MSDERLGTYQMLWDCPACGTAALLARDDKQCRNCGAPQDPTRRYFPTPDQAQAVERAANIRVDRRCPACTSVVVAEAEFCVACGSPLADAKAVPRRTSQAATDDGFAPDSARAARAEYDAARAATSSGGSPADTAGDRARDPAQRRRANRIGGVVIAIGVGGAATIGVMTWTRPVDVDVVARHWERHIDIEQYRTVHDSDWHDAMPADARNRSCYQEQRSTREVPDGETCHDARRDNGDGTFDLVRECETTYRSEPVYDTRCDYTVDRWRRRDTMTARGGPDDPLVWPHVELAQPGNCLGCDREGPRRERFVVALRDADGLAHECDVPKSRWDALAEPTGWVIERGVVTDNVDCDTLARP